MKNYQRLSLLAIIAISLLCFKTIDFGKKAPAPQKAAEKKVSLSVRKYIPNRLPVITDTAGWQFPCDEKSIRKYTAYHVSKAPVIDGKLDEDVWKKIPKSSRFVDLISGGPTLHDTYAAICWDDQNLYVAFWIEETNIAGTKTKHNDPVWSENDAEVFIAGKDSYFEFEISPQNTRYEAFFMWKEAYERDGFAANPQFALTNPLVKNFNGVGYKKHPRGLRYGSWDFEFPGLQTAVHLDGTLNDPKDHDRGWTVELAFPWKGMEWLAKADNRAYPPKNNDVWRIDFTRFNPYKEAAPAKDSGGWAWSPHGIWDSHVPECFPKITFSKKSL